MNEDTDPMQGSEEERNQYVAQINEMIAQDVEERRAQRLAEFQQTRDSKAVIVGMSGADTLIGSVNDQSGA